MITILSYPQGCSGDFVALQIHKNESYHKIQLQPNSVNRYELPCLTENVFGWEVKVSKNNITKEIVDKLNKFYNYKDLVLPTHRFRPSYHFNEFNNDDVNLVRLYTKNTDIIKLSYAMWLYKSHSILEEPYKERLQQLKNTPEPVRTELITKFHKWKYLCYYGNIMVNGQFDLGEYIKGYFKIYEQQCNLSFKKEEGYTYFDIADLIYNANTAKLEEYLNIELDKISFKNYADANYQLLKDNSVDLYSENFFDQLTDSLEDRMMQTLDLTDYDPD